MITDVSELGTILGVWAHPDDEAYLSGGLMAEARSGGQRVFVLTATRGERGTPDPVAWPPDRLANRRELELDRSLAALGVTEHAILGHSDGGCADVPLEIGAAQVAGTIDAIEPDTILTFGPDGYTGHSDHRTMSAWVDVAVDWTASRARVLHATATRPFLDEFAELHRDFDVFFAGQPSVTDPSDLTIDLHMQGHLLDRKLAALLAQRSQTEALIERMGMGRFRRWVSSERFADPAFTRTEHATTDPATFATL